MSLGRISDTLAGEALSIVEVRRPWNRLFWPHANKGFFPFKEKIPSLLRDMGMA